jgi:hypothetical protein
MKYIISDHEGMNRFHPLKLFGRGVKSHSRRLFCFVLFRVKVAILQRAVPRPRSPTDRV